MISNEYKKYCLAIDCIDAEDCIRKLVAEKSNRGMLGWQDIANIIFEKYGIDHSRHWYYRNYGDLLTLNTENTGASEDEIEDKLLELKKERVKLSDERTQNNAYIRKLAREETYKSIAIEAVNNIKDRLPLPSYDDIVKFENEEKEAVLLLSDWHYGIEFNNKWNVYNPDIAKERVTRLYKKVVSHCMDNDISHIHVLNLADLIAGRIHLTIRLESRIDVITQIMEVSELLAQFLNNLTRYFEVDYYSCLDNHSRVEPNKSDSLDLESLCRITDWYLKERLGDTVNIHDNKFGDDIITLNVLGHPIIGVHGDKDRQNSVIEKMTLFTRQSYDLACTAHMHHFSADEHTGTVLISNGALMGCDTYSKNLRLYSDPSQTLIIVSKENVTECVYRIVLT